jgi:hypothetical protein
MALMDFRLRLRNLSTPSRDGALSLRNGETKDVVGAALSSSPRFGEKGSPRSGVERFLRVQAKANYFSASPVKIACKQYRIWFMLGMGGTRVDLCLFMGILFEAR